MKKSYLAALLGSVLFMAGFALSTGASVNPGQAIPACILMAASAWLFRYAERRGASAGTTKLRTNRTTDYTKAA